MRHDVQSRAKNLSENLLALLHYDLGSSVTGNQSTSGTLCVVGLSMRRKQLWNELASFWIESKLIPIHSFLHVIP